MTFEEAKKTLEKRGFLVKKSDYPIAVDKMKFPLWEEVVVVEAVTEIAKNGYMAAIVSDENRNRLARLKKEYGKNHIKGDFSGNKSIEHCGEPGPGEEQPKENGLKAATDAFILQANEIMRLKKKNAELLEAIDKMKKGNPALEESASQFNEALLDEQAKKIAELIKEKSNLEDQITVLNACKKHNDKIDRKQIKSLGKEIARLNGIIHDKNAVLSDVAEELRLTKIREKNLSELGLKYVVENEELKEKLANKVVDKIDAQALKSAESALAYKEKVIAEKNEVIADLTHELKAKHKKYVWYKGAYDAAQQILNTIADYAAKHPDKKFSDQMVGVDNAEEGKDHSAKVVLCGKDVVKKFKENEESVFNFFKRHKETAEELYEVADEALDQLLLFGEVIIKSEK